MVSEKPFRWPTGLARKPKDAKAFYFTIAIATLLGAGLNFSSINPIDALFWSAVINGMVAVPIMVVMMVMAASQRVMGEHRIGAWLNIFGWLSTAAMGLCTMGMVAALVIK